MVGLTKRRERETFRARGEDCLNGLRLGTKKSWNCYIKYYHKCNANGISLSWEDEFSMIISNRGHVI